MSEARITFDQPVGTANTPAVSRRGRAWVSPDGQRSVVAGLLALITHVLVLWVAGLLPTGAGEGHASLRPEETPSTMTIPLEVIEEAAPAGDAPAAQRVPEAGDAHQAFDCDQLLPVERIEAIAEIFSTFKNPDKETVLTPWNVVNLQFNHTLGGADFRGGIINKTGKPEWITRGDATKIWSQDDAKILEINSKSGLYPLLAAYNMYDRQLIRHKEPEEKVSHKIWRQVLANNIYVLCKSPMHNKFLSFQNIKAGQILNKQVSFRLGTV